MGGRYFKSAVTPTLFLRVFFNNHYFKHLFEYTALYTRKFVPTYQFEMFSHKVERFT